mmetsp:Transcript_4605/g.9990  ORF Transcript_4605/g.9990 Transcript_4605/m.9990 type:complete len:240 (+) Transcript_4605:125-844(+)|eukprot:CAMPEP_0183354836 /NCGR_PEP_ID=MMETSP0164_2-20130417/38316_1 /TAXON_ID=221442 /ORGANISM="Coccolithus pelagicus ssp braarudi, Strain PLY182g" /LENGTH=239 /DNA_ID=CAMNT_0025527795 /DNA_START=121 /DNA_END=840 /DNA_ORIENTATION=-
MELDLSTPRTYAISTQRSDILKRMEAIEREEAGWTPTPSPRLDETKMTFYSSSSIGLAGLIGSDTLETLHSASLRSSSRGRLDGVDGNTTAHPNWHGSIKWDAQADLKILMSLQQSVAEKLSIIQSHVGAQSPNTKEEKYCGTLSKLTIRRWYFTRGFEIRKVDCTLVGVACKSEIRYSKAFSRRWGPWLQVCALRVTSEAHCQFELEVFHEENPDRRHTLTLRAKSSLALDAWVGYLR